MERTADRVGEMAQGLLPATEKGDSPEAHYVVKLGRRAMACDFEIRLNAGSQQESSDTPAAMAALDLIEQLEAQLTVYRETSEILEINRRAADGRGSEWIEVEPQLFKMLEYADQLYRETNGAFDLTGGPLSKVWGFHDRRGRRPTEKEIETAYERVGWDKVELNRDTQQIRFREPGVEINVNSLGKGYALDRAAELLQQAGVEDYLFHGGRSTLLAHGDRDSEQGWTVGIRHPLRPQERIARFSLQNQALSTSGSATQSFRHRDRRYGHLIDPRTGWPTEGIYSATVIAPTAMEADALSTAFYVMGADAAEAYVEAYVEAYCAARPPLQAMLVLPTRIEGEVDVRRFNL